MILVTGATGLVGGNLLWYLLQQNSSVVAIKRTTSNLEPLRTIFSFYTSEPEKFLERIEWRMADVLDEQSLLNSFAGVTVVYHCAAVVSVGNGSDALIDTNVRGTRNVVDAALKQGVAKLCFVSSIAACGQAANESTIDEKTVWLDHESRSPYARSKYYSEQEVWKGIKQGLNAVIVNPGVILGVSGNNAGSSQLFYQIKKGLMFYTLGGTGYVDVQDVVRAMMALTNSSITAERYILVSENCSNKDILCWMADGFGKRRPFVNMNRTVLLTVGFLAELAGKLFGFQPLIDRGTARSATNREYYSSEKISKAINFKFTAMEQSIKVVCEFMQR